VCFSRWSTWWGPSRSGPRRTTSSSEPAGVLRGAKSHVPKAELTKETCVGCVLLSASNTTECVACPRVVKEAAADLPTPCVKPLGVCCSFCGKLAQPPSTRRQGNAPCMPSFGRNGVTSLFQPPTGGKGCGCEAFQRARVAGREGDPRIHHRGQPQLLTASAGWYEPQCLLCNHKPTGRAQDEVPHISHRFRN
jgi:hypothetical protein